MGICCSELCGDLYEIYPERYARTIYCEGFSSSRKRVVNLIDVRSTPNKPNVKCGNRIIFKYDQSQAVATIHYPGKYCS